MPCKSPERWPPVKGQGEWRHEEVGKWHFYLVEWEPNSFRLWQCGLIYISFLEIHLATHSDSINNVHTPNPSPKESILNMEAFYLGVFAFLCIEKLPYFWSIQRNKPWVLWGNMFKKDLDCPCLENENLYFCFFFFVCLFFKVGFLRVVLAVLDLTL